MARQKTEKNPGQLIQKDGLLKSAIVIIVILAALGIGYYIFTLPPAEVKYMIGEEVDSATFTNELQNSVKTAIVMDIRGIVSEKQRGNIMQCGTDFAGSSGLVGKEIIIYAIENEKCTKLNSTSLKVNDCLNEAVSGVSIFINGGTKTTFMKNRAIIGIGEDYKFGDCKINAKYS